MSRFVNLEFGDESAGHDSAATTGGVRDEAHFMARAQEAYESGLFEPALRQYAKVLEFNPRNAAAWTGQVRMLIELGEFREAKVWADKALEQFPQEPELLAAKAVALGRAGELQEAIAFSDASIEERGNTPYVWLARADVLLSRKEVRASYCFDKALALAPKDWFTTWLAARIRFYHQQFTLALKLLQQALELQTGHFLLWLELGLCQQALGWTGPAQISLERAQELNPASDAVRAALRQVAKTGLLSRSLGWARQLFHR
jgi:tetratricopeptide (TPR) repeat protein